MKDENVFEKITPDDFFDSGDLKILLCYLLAAIREPVPGTEMAQLFHYEGIANYFDVQTAITDLESGGYITANPVHGALFSITPKGISLSNALKESVSTTLRNKVYNAVVKMLSRYKTERDTDIVLTNGSGGCTLTCTVHGNSEVDLFSFSLLLPKEGQALALKERILQDPKYYYDAFINLLTEDLHRKD